MKDRSIILILQDVKNLIDHPLHSFNVSKHLDCLPKYLSYPLACFFFLLLGFLLVNVLSSHVFCRVFYKLGKGFDQSILQDCTFNLAEVFSFCLTEKERMNQND